MDIRWTVVPFVALVVSCAGASFRSVSNEPGTFDTDFTGAGGSVVGTFSWENGSSRAEYSMDITATEAGRVEVEITDADGERRASFFLDKTSSDDTLDGVTSAGAAGTWTITVTLTDFDGDGSLHVGSLD